MTLLSVLPASAAPIVLAAPRRELLVQAVRCATSALRALGVWVLLTCGLATASTMSIHVDGQGVTHYEFKGPSPRVAAPRAASAPAHAPRSLPRRPAVQARVDAGTPAGVRYVPSDASFGAAEFAGASATAQAPVPVWSLPPLVPAAPRVATSLQTRAGINALLQQAAHTHGLDPHLLQAVVLTESAYREDAVSPKGAVGLMQLMPATAERFGWRRETGLEALKDPQTNIAAGTRYLAHLVQLYGGNLTLALAAYNAGEGAVRRYGNQVPRFPETQDYVQKVLARYQHLRAQAAPVIPTDLAAQPSAGGSSVSS